MFCTWSCCVVGNLGWTRSHRCWQSPSEKLCSGAVSPPSTEACLLHPKRLPTWAWEGGARQEKSLVGCVPADKNTEMINFSFFFQKLVWLSLLFLVWRMPSSLVGDNFLCCWNSEREQFYVRELVCTQRTKTITKNHLKHKLRIIRRLFGPAKQWY